MARDRLSHIVIVSPPDVSNFTSPSSGRAGKQIRDRDRQAHSRYLTRKFEEAWAEAQNEYAVTRTVRSGVYIEFKSEPEMDLVTSRLEDLRSKEVRLLNVRTAKEDGKDVTYATVYVANDKKRYFLDKIEAYATKETPTGRPRNADLVNSIAGLRRAVVASFWQDDPQLMPRDEKEWCEVWLSSDTDEVLDSFESLLKQEQIQAAKGHIRFPERTVKLILANGRDLEQLVRVSDHVAEYRKAKETASFWLDMENMEQAEWVRDLVARLKVIDDTNVAVCILDTGVNNGHPLLRPILRSEDCLSVDPGWGVDDHQGHGTLMAGTAAYGDLRDCLERRGSVFLHHSLESVKILPRPPVVNRKELWGHVTSQAVSRIELQAPHRTRVVCMAVAADDTRDRGRPTSWSGRIDQLASGDGEEDGPRRLFVVAAGNTTDEQKAGRNYPHATVTDSIHDPGQAWNALTVGAYTTLDRIQNPVLTGFSPVARGGQISPFTTTSTTWDMRWPIKPEIVMEGGNLAVDRSGFLTRCDDLSLLSTHHQTTEGQFRDFEMTSAATAQAAWFAAQIYSKYPDLWPETVRALMVHSAEWTEAMKAQFLVDDKKGSYGYLLRICGYGVPNLEHALFSARNSLTLIAENEIQPYDRKPDDSGFRTKEMHLYNLPWPKEVLQDLPLGTQVTMRVTLSYFVEPGPGEIGWKDRYRYASHGLRFDLKSPTEDIDAFQRRVNKAAWTEEDGRPGTKGPIDHWVIGPEQRNRGSIHSDIWRGTAQELASSNVIAIYPIVGWWRERHHLDRWNRRSRYSLIVSITTPESTVDIYTPVAQMVGITIPILPEA